MTQRDPLDIATLIRLASDGELTDAQREVLDRHLESHPGDGVRIEFDRQLRTATARVMDMRCPRDVRARVEAMASGEVEPSAISDHEEDDAPIAIMSSRRFAMAAAVLVLLGAFAHFRSIQAPIHHPDLPVQIAGFVIDQHVRGEGTPLNLSTSDLIEEYPSLYCTRAQTRLDRIHMVLQQVSDCDFPDGTNAIHLRIIGDGADGAHVPISIFIEEDTGQLDLEAGRSYSYDCGEVGIADKRILMWKAEGRIYFLVSDCPLLTPTSYATMLRLPKPELVGAP
ncbi:MAG: hypothetical protein KDA28_04925 [Phycisphaerales bacterium]|nr:hypothetical protein [Phycisphaerales bacterium]